MSQFPGMVRPNYPPGPPGYRPPGMASHPMYQNRPAASQGSCLKSLRVPIILSQLLRHATNEASTTAETTSASGHVI